MEDIGTQSLFVTRQEISGLMDNSTIITDVTGGGYIGTAADTVDLYSIFNIDQITARQTLQLPDPTATTFEKTVYINNISTNGTSFIIFSTTLQPGGGLIAQWTGSAYSIIGTSSGATNVTVVGGKTFTVDNTLTLAGTDHTIMTFPSNSATIARTDAANTFSGVQTFSTHIIVEGVTSTGATGTGNLVFAASPTITGTATFTHVIIEGVTSTGATGTGSLVFATTPTLTNPTLTTPVIGVATGTSLAVTGKITSSGIAGIGYATGAGALYTQITSRTTTVDNGSKTSGTSQALVGSIITFATAVGSASWGSANVQTFTFTNTSIAATDQVNVNVKSGGTLGAYYAWCSSTGAGTCTISIMNVSGGSLTEAVTLTYAIIKGVAA